MQQIQGKARGTLCYIYDGYQYHVDTTHVHIYRCSTRSSTGCRGAARVDEQGFVNVYRAHQGHEANPTLYDELKMKKEMLDLAASTNTSLKDIFDNVCRSNPTVAPKLNYRNLKSSMERARSKNRPVIPNTLRELATALDAYPPMQAVYRGFVEGEDDSVALIFASDQLIDELKLSDEIYIDGTFKVTPNHPPIAQMFSIHIRVEDTGIAAVFILCSARTRALYDAIFTKIKTLAPSLVDNLKFVMGDYERAAMRAVRDAFPAAKLHGCWFHFNQAIWRYWRHLGLTNAPRTLLSLAMALPLAPVNRFNEGLGILGDIADDMGDTYPRVLRFMRYLRTQWQPLADVVSVYGCPSRTNNIVESFHSQAKRKLGGLHPNIWKFLELLLNLIVDQGIDLVRAKNHERVGRGRTIKDMRQDTHIRDAQHALSVNRFTLRQFLERCATRTPGVRSSTVPEEDYTAELVEPGLLTRETEEAAEPVRRSRRRRNVPEQARREPGIVEPALHEAQNEPLNAQPGALGADNQRLDESIDFGNPEDFHLPEDDWEVFEQPAEPIPYHPIAPLEENERAAAERAPGTCCICLETSATHAIITCGHQCCCGECAVVLIGGRCPICRGDVAGTLRIIANI